MTRDDDRRQAAAAHRGVLMKRLSELTNRVARIDDDLRQPHSSDWIERATEVENDDVLERLDSAVRDEIVQVKAALRRIDEGMFGIIRLTAATTSVVSGVTEATPPRSNRSWRTGTF